MAPGILFSWRVRVAALVSAIVVASAAFIAIRAVTRPASAQAAFVFMYSAKYVCVPEVGPPTTAVIPQGTGITYRTVINVHNPNASDVDIGKKAAVGLTERAPQPGKISQVVPLSLVPDQVLSIDCTDIKTLLGGPQATGDGMVVIFSSASLDVWAAYTKRGVLTSAQGGVGLDGNIDVVWVPERRIQ